MRRRLTLAVLVLAACSSTGIVQLDRDTYMLQKSRASPALGVPGKVTRQVYEEANAFCAKQGKMAETVSLEQRNQNVMVPGYAKLTFRCVEREEAVEEN